MYSAFLFTLGILNFTQIPWKNPEFDAERTLENPGIFFHFIVRLPDNSFEYMLLSTVKYKIANSY